MALEDELSCPVCTEVFGDPVLLSCGHSFCRQCIDDHWSSSSSRNCPVCRQVSPQPPVSNLCLRNTCESYLREQSTGEQRDGEHEHECPVHGDKLELFCQTDEQVLCAECKKREHGKHKTQPLQQAVRQRKERLKAALRPAEKALWSLQNAAAPDAKISSYNQTQVQQTERRIREEFKKLQQFLRREEESRIAAVKKEEKEKRVVMEKRRKNRIRSLTDRLRQVEEEMKDDDITFLENYNSIMNRAKNKLKDAELSRESLIDVPKHLGNLRYHVWEKMKDVCPYYPVVLDTNTAPPDVSVSDDLTSVTSCLHRQDKPNALPQHSGRMVLGSVGYSSGVHTWDIEVGNSPLWTLGVCLGSVERSIGQTLNPENGLWGLKRDGDVYRFLNTQIMFKMQTNPPVVRVRLEEGCDERGGWWRNVCFIDASCNSGFAKIFQVPSGMELFPFVIPGKHSGLLRVLPVKVSLTTEPVEEEISFFEKHSFLWKIRWLFLCLLAVLFLFALLWGFVANHLVD